MLRFQFHYVVLYRTDLRGSRNGVLTRLGCCDNITDPRRTLDFAKARSKKADRSRTES